MSLRTVAAEAGISASLLSQVENGRTQPSVGTLYSIVTFLGISIDELLGTVPGEDAGPARGPLPPDGPVQYRRDAPRIEMQNGVTWERMATGGFAGVDPLRTSYDPGAASTSDGKFLRHSGIEYGYLIEGELTLRLGFDTYRLAAGDSLCFSSHRPHLYVNESSQVARGIWFVHDTADPLLSGGTVDLTPEL